MIIKKAELQDMEDIPSLQKRAYISGAEIYNDFEIPPLIQILDEIKNEFSSHVFIKAIHKNKIIGSV